MIVKQSWRAIKIWRARAYTNVEDFAFGVWNGRGIENITLEQFSSLLLFAKILLYHRIHMVFELKAKDSRIEEYFHGAFIVRNI